MILKEPDIRRVILYFLFYLLLLLIHGYYFGSHDQIDFMPYARHIQDNLLYSKDFYIGCMTGHLNERWLIAHLISLIPAPWWPMGFLFLHCLVSILLLHGLYSWSRMFLKSEVQIWSSLFITLILLYHRNLGGNELYYNMFAASLLAKAAAIWALWYAYHSNLYKAIALTSLASYLHPIVGAQILLLSFVLMDRPMRWKYLLVSLVCISPYLYILLYDLHATLPDKLFVEIMRLRNAHHFFPDAFGRLNYFLLTPLFLFCLFRFYQLDQRLARMLLFIVVGCILYGVIIYYLPKYAILTQWFKTTIWLKFFSVIAILNLINEQNVKNWLKSPLTIGMVVIGFTAYKINRNLQLNYSMYQLPGSADNHEMTIAKEAKKITAKDAVFITPPDFTSFKYFAERSTFIDWKAIPHRDQCLDTWYNRVNMVYGLQFEQNMSLSDIYKNANTHLLKMSDDQKFKLKTEGVDYIISRSQVDGPYTMMKLD